MRRATIASKKPFGNAARRGTMADSIGPPPWRQARDQGRSLRLVATLSFSEPSLSQIFRPSDSHPGPVPFPSETIEPQDQVEGLIPWNSLQLDSDISGERGLGRELPPAAFGDVAKCLLKVDVLEIHVDRLSLEPAWRPQVLGPANLENGTHQTG